MVEEVGVEKNKEFSNLDELRSILNSSKAQIVKIVKPNKRNKLNKPNGPNRPNKPDKPGKPNRPNRPMNPKDPERSLKLEPQVNSLKRGA